MLADDIEKGNVPYPYSIGGTAYWNHDEDGRLAEGVTPADARTSMSLTPGGWRKNEGTTHVDYTKHYGGNVSFSVTCARENIPTCHKVTTGQRWVETVPAVAGHYEDVTEYRCDDTTDADTELAD
jgi:hypothetical protein